MGGAPVLRGGRGRHLENTGVRTTARSTADGARPEPGTGRHRPGGHCCRGGEGYVWVNEREIDAMAGHLGLDVLEFARKYVRRIGTAYRLRELADFIVERKS